jgi:hypothetical protein
MPHQPMIYYAVLRERGENWNARVPKQSTRAHPDWTPPTGRAGHRGWTTGVCPAVAATGCPESSVGSVCQTYHAQDTCGDLASVGLKAEHSLAKAGAGGCQDWLTSIRGCALFSYWL